LSTNPRRILNEQVVEPHYEQVPIAQLKFDVDNQRLKHLLRTRLGGKAPSQKDCMESLWGLSDTKELFTDIKENGGLRTPICATADHTVVEGNRRLSCLKKLHELHPKDNKWQTVSTEVFPENTTRMLIREFLFAEHVAGRKDWDAYEQAEYVYRLHHEDGKSYDWLATNGHVSKSKVRQQFLAYELMTLFLKEHPEADIRKFNYFAEMVSKPMLRGRLDSDSRDYDPDFFKEMTSLVALGRLTDAKQVRSVPDFLRNPKAMALLKRSGFEAALSFLDNEDPTRRSGVWAAIQNATNIINNLGVEEIADISTEEDPRLILIRNLVGAIRRFEKVTRLTILT
jgi:hypothetical protein